jgi:toluene monooxygenase system protein B
MADVPLCFVFRGDVVTQLVAVEDTDTMDEVAGKVAHHIAGRRQPLQDAPLRVSFKGEVQPADRTVLDAGIVPMDYIEVFYA